MDAEYTAPVSTGHRWGLIIVLLGLISLALLPARAQAASPILLETFGSFARPSGVAVDEATGNVFVTDGSFENVVKIFGPEGEAPVGVASSMIGGFSFGSEPAGVAIDNDPTSPSFGALYVADVGSHAVKKFELNAATETYEEVGQLSASPGFGEVLDVEVGPTGQVFVSDWSQEAVIVFAPTGTEVMRINVSGSVAHPSGLALDSLGDLFVQGYGFSGSGPVFEYPADGSGEVDPSVTPVQVVSDGASGIAVDRSSDTLYVALGKHIAQYDAQSLASEGEFGNGSLEFTERLEVNSETARIYVADRGPNHIAVFGPAPPPCPPSVEDESASAIYTEAALTAHLNPCNDAVTYRFEYGPTDAYGSTTPAETAPTAYEPLNVVSNAFGLLPGTEYHYRVVVENSQGTAAGSDQTFKTELRRGPGLPDNRAYELVSPPETNAIYFQSYTNDDVFDTYAINAAGTSVIYNSNGLLPGMEGNGNLDSYRSRRTASGWVTEAVSPTGVQAKFAQKGGTSADHEYAFWEMNGGTLGSPEGTHYIRLPNGAFELVGRGELGDDPNARGRWITPGGTHVIFATEAGTSVQLESDAPSAGVGAIYDRAIGGETKVVSLLPNDVIPATSARYIAASEDGTAVVFMIGETMYERLDNSTTVEIAGEEPTFEGISTDGTKVFYLSGGNIFGFDVLSETTTPIGSGGEATVVNVSADGSHVYFSSPQQLVDSEGLAGARNLYVWNGTDVRFIATLSDADFEAFGTPVSSLANWSAAVGPEQSSQNGRGNVPTRTTPNGKVFIFQSHGVAGFPYDSSGHSEVYRFDEETGGLSCLSCPAGEATAEADLQSTGANVENAPTTASTRITNVTDDGRTVFFQSGDSLVPEDTDGLRDVYEWKEGQVSLLSSGRSRSDDFLLGMTPDGHDVVFKTGDRLVPQDETGGAGSIYDARIDGGFPRPVPSASCSEASCQGSGTPGPSLEGAGTESIIGRAPHRRHHHRHHRRRHRHKKHHQRTHHHRASNSRGGSK